MRKHLLLLSIAISIGVLLLSSCGGDSPNEPVKPTGLIAVNGLYYKGAMGDSVFNQPLEFAVTDDKGNYLPNQQIQVDLIEGDGNLGPRSITTDSAGIASFAYTFSGSLGHAVVRLTIPDRDTLEVFLRADVLIPGEHGQGQYILFDDTFQDVKNFNGQPERVDVDPNFWQNYVLYEHSSGVVVVIIDSNQDKLANDTESVIGIIVDSIYAGKTLSNPPIGLGSNIDNLRAAYGEPTSIEYDPTPPASNKIKYKALGATFFATLTSDTTVFEIHLSENIPPSSNSKSKNDDNLTRKP